MRTDDSGRSTDRLPAALLSSVLCRYPQLATPRASCARPVVALPASLAGADRAPGHPPFVAAAWLRPPRQPRARPRRLRSAIPCRASARTGRGGENRKPWPSARRNRAGRPRCLRSRSSRRSGRCRSGRPDRRDRRGGCRWRGVAPRLSRRLAGTLMKRKPRSARSRGSMRRSVTLSREKRKPRSASAARLSCSIGPMARTALCVSSSTSEGAIARLASMNSRNCGK